MAGKIESTETRVTRIHTFLGCFCPPEVKCDCLALKYVVLEAKLQINGIIDKRTDLIAEARRALPVRQPTRTEWQDHRETVAMAIKHRGEDSINEAIQAARDRIPPPEPPGETYVNKYNREEVLEDAWTKPKNCRQPETGEEEPEVQSPWSHWEDPSNLEEYYRIHGPKGEAMTYGPGTEVHQALGTLLTSSWMKKALGSLDELKDDLDKELADVITRLRQHETDQPRNKNWTEPLKK